MLSKKFQRMEASISFEHVSKISWSYVWWKPRTGRGPRHASGFCAWWGGDGGMGSLRNFILLLLSHRSLSTAYNQQFAPLGGDGRSCRSGVSGAGSGAFGAEPIVRSYISFLPRIHPENRRKERARVCWHQLFRLNL